MGDGGEVARDGRWWSAGRPRSPWEIASHDDRAGFRPGVTGRRRWRSGSLAVIHIRYRRLRIAKRSPPRRILMMAARSPGAFDQDEALAYLTEHLAYERQMLGYTFARLHDTEPGLAWNAVYESFSIHARNIYDFLRHEGGNKTNFRADQFVVGHRKPNHLAVFNDLDVYAFHLSMKRDVSSKPDLSRLTMMGAWLDKHWASWVNLLPEPFAGRTDKTALCRPREMQCGVTQATACSVVTASTVHPLPDDGSSFTIKLP